MCREMEWSNQRQVSRNRHTAGQELSWQAEPLNWISGGQNKKKEMSRHCDGSGREGPLVGGMIPAKSPS